MTFFGGCTTTAAAAGGSGGKSSSSFVVVRSHSSGPPPPPPADGGDIGENGENDNPRQKISSVKISEVLKRKHTLRWVEPVISIDATIRDAITVCIERKLNAMMVVDKSDHYSVHRDAANSGTMELKQKCIGLVTSRDILRAMASGIKDGRSSDEILDERISDSMTPISHVIYGRPDETIAMCRAIMAKLGIKCLPILAEGRVEGILTARDMQDVYFDAKDRGGKKNYLRDISERVGLSSDTSMASVSRDDERTPDIAHFVALLLLLLVGMMIIFPFSHCCCCCCCCCCCRCCCSLPLPPRTAGRSARVR